MRFMLFDGNQIFVEFDKKQMMHMKMLERKKQMIDGALSDAFGKPVGIVMRVEDDANAPKSVSAVARDVINQSYDIFGRDKIDIVD